MSYSVEFQDSTSDTHAHAYREWLNCWAIARLLPDMQRLIVARFRSRSDADGHLQFLRHQIPDGEFIVVFDRYQSAE